MNCQQQIIQDNVELNATVSYMLIGICPVELCKRRISGKYKKSFWESQD